MILLPGYHLFCGVGRPECSSIREGRPPPPFMLLGILCPVERDATGHKMPPLQNILSTFHGDLSFMLPD